MIQKMTCVCGGSYLRPGSGKAGAALGPVNVSTALKGDVDPFRLKTNFFNIGVVHIDETTAKSFLIFRQFLDARIEDFLVVASWLVFPLIGRAFVVHVRIVHAQGRNAAHKEHFVPP